MAKSRWKKIVAAFLAAGLIVTGGGGKRVAGNGFGEAGLKTGTDGTPVLTTRWNGGADLIGKRVTARIPEPEPDTASGDGQGTDADTDLGTKEEKGNGDGQGTDEDTDADAKEEKANGEFRAAKDYKELLDAFRGGNHFFYGEMNHFYAMDSVAEDAGMPGDAPAGAGLTETAEPAGKDYSDTNVQVEGIAEADIVKTDGEYIYILSKREGTSGIYIVRAKDGVLAMESSFSPDGSLDVWQEEMYVSGNRLAVVRHGIKRQEPGKDGGEYFFDVWFGYHGERQTEVLVYDITDRRAPFLVGSHVQDGDYVSSREKDGYLYVVSEKEIFYNYIQPMDQVWIGDVGNRTKGHKAELTEEDLARLPLVDGEPLAPGCIYFREDAGDSVYTVVTAICLEMPEKLVDSISFMAGSGHCYMSGNAIYLAAYDWYYNEGDSEHTEIVKISYADGKLGFAAQGKVKGSLDDQFSMDEKDGYLRVVTTVEEYKPVQKSGGVWEGHFGRSNALYVLGPGMEVAGSLEGLAEDERIYSARFIGDTAYFVTFRNTDPLFCVDVSDPGHPVLLGALKIPGFSDYLHPYGENLLLGIGYDADETGAVGCVKLTMFDISDPLAVTEKHTLVLEGYGSSEACHNHRAVLVDEGKNLIGLPFENSYYGRDGYQGYTEEKGYAVYGYDEENGFYRRFEERYEGKWDWEYYYDGKQAEQAGEAVAADDWNDWYHMRLRGIYIGDYFYLVNQVREIRPYRMGQEGFFEMARMSLR